MIRAARQEDVPAVETCAGDAYAKYVERIGNKPAPMVSDFEAQVRNGIVYISIDDNDQFEGFVVFYPREDHLHLENVAVASQHQGKGVGKRLIEFCENVARNLGIDKVELYTNEKMTENLDLYPHLNYEEVGRWSEDGFSRVFYRKMIL